MCTSEHLPSVPSYPVSKEPLHLRHTGHQQTLLYIIIIFTHCETTFPLSPTDTETQRNQTT